MFFPSKKVKILKLSRALVILLPALSSSDKRMALFLIEPLHICLFMGPPTRILNGWLTQTGVGYLLLTLVGESVREYFTILEFC